MKRSLILLTVLFPFLSLVTLMAAARLQASPSHAPGATFTVNNALDATDANPGDGVCETAVGNSICTLRAAVQETNALPGADTVVLPPATYILTLAGANEDASMTGDLDVTDTLTIMGEDADTTVIDANQIDRVFHFHAAASVSGVAIFNGHVNNFAGGGIYVNFGRSLNLDNSKVLSNATTFGNAAGIYNEGTLTITNSSILTNVIHGNSVFFGGGIYNRGTLTLNNAVIQGNDAGFGYGGGIINDSERTLSIQNSTIRHNHASYGGGIYASGYVDITTSQVVSNTAVTGAADGDKGGGINVSEFGQVVISESTIQGNDADQGGGIFVSGMMTMTNSSVSHNTAYAYGGGVYKYTQGMILIEDTRINHNQTNPFGLNSGGGIFASGGITPESLTLRRVTVDHNQAGRGAALGVSSSNASIENSTISGNETTGPAAETNSIYVTYGTISIVNTTIANNISGIIAGDGAVVAGNGGVITLTNSIVANNINGNCREIGTIVPGIINTAGYNVDSEDSCGFNAEGDLVNTDPLLGPLQDNGGATWTHALLADSPAIDAGNNVSCPLTDQRGIGRPQGVSCDIGAYELFAATNFVYLPVILKPGG